jgi:hypothetical protein
LARSEVDLDQTCASRVDLPTMRRLSQLSGRDQLPGHYGAAKDVALTMPSSGTGAWYANLPSIETIAELHVMLL